MKFSYDFSMIESGYRETDKDNFKKKDKFGMWDHFRYRRFRDGE